MPEKLSRFFKKAIPLFDDLKYSLGKRRQQALLQAGGSEEIAGNKQAADALYSKAYRYPWYAVSNPCLQDFLALYMNAASDLIRV